MYMCVPFFGRATSTLYMLAFCMHAKLSLSLFVQRSVLLLQLRFKFVLCHKAEWRKPLVQEYEELELKVSKLATEQGGIM